MAYFESDQAAIVSQSMIKNGGWGSQSVPLICKRQPYTQGSYHQINSQLSITNNEKELDPQSGKQSLYSKFKKQNLLQLRKLGQVEKLHKMEGWGGSVDKCGKIFPLPTSPLSAPVTFKCLSHVTILHLFVKKSLKLVLSLEFKQEFCYCVHQNLLRTNSDLPKCQLLQEKLLFKQ